VTAEAMLILKAIINFWKQTLEEVPLQKRWGIDFNKARIS
jgi:hypothetical protein